MKHKCCPIEGGGGEGTTDKVKEEKERINNNKNKRELVKNQKEEEKKEMKGGKFKKWVERMNKTHEKKKSPSSLFPLFPPPIPLSSSPSRLPLGLSRHADNDDLDSGLQNRRITTGI